MRRYAASAAATASSAIPPAEANSDGLKALRYEDTKASKPPVLVDRPPPREQALRQPRANGETNRLTKRPPMSPSLSTPLRARRTYFGVDKRRDSGIATTAGTSPTINGDGDASNGSAEGPTVPQILVGGEGHDGVTADTANGISFGGESHLDGVSSSREEADKAFRISMNLPSENLLGLDSMDQLSFSKRGSILLGGRKGVSGNKSNGNSEHDNGSAQADSPTLGQNAFSSPILSQDEDILSQRVRSMYEYGEYAGPDYKSGRLSRVVNGSDPVEEAISDEDAGGTPMDAMRRLQGTSSLGHSLAPSTLTSSRASRVVNRRESMIIREENELAGGIEDWDNLEGQEVDRYGFIVPAKSGYDSANSSVRRAISPEPNAPHRVSTILHNISESPRRRRSYKRSPSATRTTRSETPVQRAVSRKTSGRSLRPPGSISSYQDSVDYSRSTTGPSPLRFATNRLPQNRGRRWMDEAGDMLTLPPGLADIVEQEEGGKAEQEMKEKEVERMEKWRKMAKVVKIGKTGSDANAIGEGMRFEFDTRDPKLITRTWKGIPDRWRAAAWSSFLRASASLTPNSLTDAQLTQTFHHLTTLSSADDVQIDIDVPRTINAHIMFRRRYRGGQRLLFRVLHAMSLYCPSVGYVQGMASLAATLLCYFDEESAFVMMVRLWDFRGCKRLYDQGFNGLMAALAEFESWIGPDVAAKLTLLGIPPTSYGTRWYLTLFNYSIPFPAQLRVWDVFMLYDPRTYPPLSTPSIPRTPKPPSSSASNRKTLKKAAPDKAPGEEEQKASFGAQLDVLHAVSAALIDGTREILLDSDFENAMKVLTSWIPIRDEDLLMNVAYAEWRRFHRR